MEGVRGRKFFASERFIASACPIGQNAETKFSSSLFEIFLGRAKSEKCGRKFLLRRSRRFAAARRRCVAVQFQKFLLKYVRAWLYKYTSKIRDASCIPNFAGGGIHQNLPQYELLI